MLIVFFCTLLALYGAPAPVATTPHFAFYSDPDTNLNDALITAGLARKRKQPELFHAGDEQACFEKLPRPVRVAWERAVDYYADVVSPQEFNAREQFLIRMDLSGHPEEVNDDRAREFVAIARGFRAAAAPAYTACRWPAQDKKNREWIAELQPLLAAHEQKIASRLEQLYRTRYSSLPLRVDIVQTVSWAGANSIILDSGGGHLLVSIENPLPAGLEVVFHESSHLFMRRGDPVYQAVNAAIKKTPDAKPPSDLWHVVLFYTTGEAVRQVLADAGTRDYKPMFYSILDRGPGPWTGTRAALEAEWLPYIEGKRSLDDAATKLIEAIRKPQ